LIPVVAFIGSGKPAGVVATLIYDSPPGIRFTMLVGVNQTILLSLSMVVVTSAIVAKGLGKDVLEAVQYAAAGQGFWRVLQSCSEL